MRVLIALGSNLGNRADFLRRALVGLERSGLGIRATSELFETRAWGGAAGGDRSFLNAVVIAESELGPWELLRRMKDIERRLGRDPQGPRNAPRPIDLDLLAALGTTVSSPELTLPHPRLWGRDFVRAPLDTLKDAAAFFPGGPPSGRGLPVRRVGGRGWHRMSPDASLGR
ncbi:MAG: 2-amino-4-hydroxy-6-hydroxymethyldihydropteridine diphosphokinase [Planctomycetota bacterium]